MFVPARPAIQLQVCRRCSYHASTLSVSTFLSLLLCNCLFFEDGQFFQLPFIPPAAPMHPGNPTVSQVETMLSVSSLVGRRLTKSRPLYVFDVCSEFLSIPAYRLPGQPRPLFQLAAGLCNSKETNANELLDFRWYYNLPNGVLPCAAHLRVQTNQAIMYLTNQGGRHVDVVAEKAGRKPRASTQIVLHRQWGLPVDTS